MRLLTIVFACCLLLIAFSANGQQSFPYKAHVTAEDVYVRSGPGQNYYPTDKLKPNQIVEVYRHDPGGWCAIRPVESSYTWVSGRYLKPTENGLAMVTEENVQARVGSRMSDVRDVVQVRLRKGEFVELIDAAARSKLGQNVWIRIQPPAGEFRWVANKYLEPEQPLGRPHGQGPDDRPPAMAHGEPAHMRPSGPRTLSPQAFELEIQRLDLELSAMVTEDPANWSLELLRDRANHLLDQAQTAVERGHVRVLANKIARFEDIKQRADAVNNMHEQNDRSARLLAGLRYKPLEEPRNRYHSVDDRFDAVGQLSTVASPRRGAPRFALLDERGDVRCYVTAAPGVNLQRFVGKEVGVTGTRGYMPEQRTSHLMARHITPLDDSRLLR